MDNIACQKNATTTIQSTNEAEVPFQQQKDTNVIENSDVPKLQTKNQLENAGDKNSPEFGSLINNAGDIDIFDSECLGFAQKECNNLSEIDVPENEVKLKPNMLDCKDDFVLKKKAMIKNVLILPTMIDPTMNILFKDLLSQDK